MTVQSMFGVVLWSDMAAQKAVIWCEDQGELAYYTPCSQTLHNAPVLDAGDLIQFDVVVKRNMRTAQNPQLLEQSHSPDLQTRLLASKHPRSTAPVTEKVVDISGYLGGTNETCLRRSG